MTANLATVEFHGHPLVTLKQDDTILVALKPIVEGIGLDWRGQHKRIQRDDVLSTCVVVMTMQLPGDTQRREVLFLPLQYLNGWLFGVDTHRIKNPEVRERINQYKRECYEVLYRYWHGKELESTPETLTPSEQQTLQEIARAKVQDLPDDLKGKALAEIWSRVHRKFRVAKYSQLQRDKLAEAILYINRMQLKCLPKPEGLKLLKEPDDIGPKTRAIIDRRAQELALQSFQRAREALEDLARQWKQVRPFLSDGAIAEFIATRDLRKESYLVVRRGAVYEITSAVAALQPLIAHILEAIEQLETETDLPWHGKSQVKAH